MGLPWQTPFFFAYISFVFSAPVSHLESAIAYFSSYCFSEHDTIRDHREKYRVQRK
jgi:hypothetical protein